MGLLNSLQFFQKGLCICHLHLRSLPPSTNRIQLCQCVDLLRERQVRVARVRFVGVMAGECFSHVGGNVCVREPRNERVPQAVKTLRAHLPATAFFLAPHRRDDLGALHQSAKTRSIARRGAP